MPLMTNRIGIVIASALLCGCSHFHAATAGGRPPTDLPPQNNAPRTQPRATGGVSRTICRTAGVPSGYVVIDYVISRDCETSPKRPFNAMLVEDISNRPLGTVVRICAGQRRPADWEPTYRTVEETSQCPRDRTDQSTSSTVMEIVRNRNG